MTNRELLLFLSNQGYFDLETHVQKNDVEIRNDFYFAIDKEGNITAVYFKSGEWINVSNGLDAKKWFDKMEELRKEIYGDD